MPNWNMLIKRFPKADTPCKEYEVESFNGTLQYEVSDSVLSGSCYIPDYYPETMTVAGCHHIAADGSATLRFVCEAKDIPKDCQPVFHAVQITCGSVPLLLAGGAFLPDLSDGQFDPGDEGSWTASHQ